jgi:hypothetical protein
MITFCQACDTPAEGTASREFVLWANDKELYFDLRQLMNDSAQSKSLWLDADLR